MKNILPKSIEKLSTVLATLPGIGPKTANRLTFYLLSRSKEELLDFAEAFGKLKDQLVTCSTCYMISESDPCLVCSDKGRERKTVAIVEETMDVLALEKAHYGGLYHVLGGQISPLHDIAPEDLAISQLIGRLGDDQIDEIILATDPSLEGEATSLYIDDQIKKKIMEGKIRKELVVSRIARGLPVGGDLEYADELTLSRALEGRRSYTNE